VASVAPPQILLLTPIAPAPTGNGLAMRAALAVEGLALAGDLWTAVLPVAGPRPEESALAWTAARAVAVAAVELPGGTAAARGWLELALGREILATSEPLPGRARLASPAAGVATRNALEKLAREKGLVAPTFDAVYVLRLYLAGAALPFLGSAPAPRAVLDADDDDATTLGAIARLHEERGERQAAEREWLEAEAYARLAAAVLPRFDRILTAAPNDARALAARHDLGDRVAGLSNAVDLSRPARPATSGGVSGPQRLLFVGNLGYLPNLDAVERLATAILPMIHQHDPDARLDVVGGGAPGRPAAGPTSGSSGSGRGASLFGGAAPPGVSMHGAVEDLVPFYERANAVVVPLRAGGGSRIKLLEAFAFGVPVVATPQAAAGLHVRHGEELLLASSDRELAESVARLAADPGLASYIARQASLFVEEHHDLERVSEQLAAIAGLLSSAAS
jgi:glycosyltransferase involved in cell wall biosynthesis